MGILAVMSWEDDDWEADDVEPVAPVKPAKEEKAWDDDDSEEEEPPAKVQPKPKNEANKGPIGKATVKSKKDLLKNKEGPKSAMSAEQSRVNQQELVEAGDMALTEELFGIEASGSAADPVNRDEHEALGTIMGKKAAMQVGSFHFGAMMKAFLKEALVEAKSDQVKELTTMLNPVFAEKQKAEKALETKGKKGKKNTKKTLAKDHGMDGGDEFDVGLTTSSGYAHQGFDDGDFM